MKIYKVVLFLLCIGMGMSAFSQVKTDTLSSAEAKKMRKKIDRELKKAHQKTTFKFLPILYYTPETRLAFGASGIYGFKFNPNDTLLPVSQIKPSFIYTQNKQMMATISYQLYVNKNWIVSGTTGYLIYPYFFSGVGNDHDVNYKEWYDAKYPMLETNVYRRVYKKTWSVGLKYRFQNTRITSEPDSLLGKGNVPGDGGSIQSALGVGVKYNTTDYELSPTKGWKINTYSMWATSAFGADYEDQVLHIDIRKYIPLSKKQDVLAAQVYLDAHSGDVPFNLMSMLGGRYRMRGYQEGVYRDRQMHVYQLEYRSRMFFKYFGFVVFGNYGGVGNVFDEVANNYRYTLGTGLRFTPLPEKRYFIRLDYGVGNGTQGIYFEIGEAF
jgi:hypothetical protein